MTQLCKGQKTTQCFLEQQSISAVATKIWEIVPCEIKNAKLLYIFKEKIKLWTNVLADFAKSALAI